MGNKVLVTRYFFKKAKRLLKKYKTLKRAWLY